MEKDLTKIETGDVLQIKRWSGKTFLYEVNDPNCFMSDSQWQVVECTRLKFDKTIDEYVSFGRYQYLSIARIPVPGCQRKPITSKSMINLGKLRS